MKSKSLTVSQKQKLDDTVEKIGVLFSSVRTNVIELAKLIVNTEKDKVLRVRLLEELKTRKVMNESTYSQLRTIGYKTTLQEPHILPFLPRTQTTIYQIAKELTSEEIELNIKKKKINELSTNDDIIDIINEKKDKSGSGNKTDRKLFTVKISQENFKKYNLNEGKDKLKKKIENAFPYLKITN